MLVGAAAGEGSEAQIAMLDELSKIYDTKLKLSQYVPWPQNLAQIRIAKLPVSVRV
jgi:hypothetical protein